MNGLVTPGHGAGDVLEAPDWKVLVREPGLVRVEAHLPDHLKNPEGQLFGGFTPAYVDFISIFTVHSLHPDPAEGAEDERPWITTINLRCDYFEPIMGPTFEVEGRSVNQRGRNHLVAASFYSGDLLAAHALTTLREMPRS